MEIFESAKNLVEEYGSPCFALSLNEVEKNFLALEEALPGVKFYYAVKANPEKAILKRLASLGCYFDVSTNKEVEQVVQCGVSSEKSIHTHPIKLDHEIQYALECGVKYFTVDNIAELEKFIPYKDVVKLSIRLSIDNDDCRINLSEKFGCSPDEAEVLLERAQVLGLKVTCLSFHVGSQCSNPARYIEALNICRELDSKASAYNAKISTIDIGGGFPVQYADDPVDIKIFCAEISSYLEKNFSDKEIIAEPGRFLVASSMSLITTIKGKSDRSGKIWYFIDDSIYQSFSGIVFDHCNFPLLHNKDGVLKLSQIAGATCDSCDVIKRDVELPEFELNDLLIFKQMGAYCSASSSHFNGYAPTQIITTEIFN